MTMQADTHGQRASAIPPADSYHLARAEDGDVLLVMQGSELDAGREVAVEVRDGVLSVSQGGGGSAVRTVVRAPVDAEGRAMLAPLPSLQIVEVYLGDTEDETRFERHPAPNVRLRYEGKDGHA